MKIKVQNCNGINAYIFIVALKLKGISMCTVTNKFRRNVVEKAFIQEIQVLMSNQMSNLQTFSESL